MLLVKDMVQVYEYNS